MSNKDVLNDLSFGRAGYSTSATADASAQSKAAAGSGASPETAFTFSNSAPITIPLVGNGSPYPSNIIVSGVTNPVARVMVTLNNINHTFPDDIDILLVGPGGQKTILMSDAGTNLDITGVTLTFDDTSTSFLPDAGQIVSGPFHPTDINEGIDPFPLPAPPGPYVATLSAFAGTLANGTWSLYVVDDAGGDSGIIMDGWSLTILDGDSVVTNTNDSGPGSLRQAILDANAASDRNTITFNIPGSGVVHTITPTSALPSIVFPVIIDGKTQPGYAGPPLIELKGTSLAAGVNGLSLFAEDCVVEGLVINGFNGVGIFLGAPARNSIVQTNFIGTNAAGNAASPNTVGVLIDGAANNFVGGNLISGNAEGIIIRNGANSNSFWQNNIGTDSHGTGALGNLFAGLVIESTSSGNTIGGVPIQANTIAFNLGEGILLATTAGTGNAIFTNHIFSNGRLGIDLGGDATTGNGVTPNDERDADTGPNNQQNFPVLTSAISNTGNNTTTVIGSLDSTPSFTFTLQFFSNPSCDSSGNGEGKTYLGSTTVTTPIDGNPVSFIVAFPLTVPVGQVVTATATYNTTRDTSEFSACRTVTGDSPTAVDEPEFAAAAYDDGVLLHWQTGLEVNNLGFNVYRDEGGKVSLVNSQLIAGSAFLVGSDIILGSGHSYQWWDKGIADCGSPIADCQKVAYWLEDRDISGQSSWHGPFYPARVAGKQLPSSVQQARTLASLSMNKLTRCKPSRAGVSFRRRPLRVRRNRCNRSSLHRRAP
ncbi:MAG: hypothetical protein AABO41_06110 [Acidobacteriota bacterium]